MKCLLVFAAALTACQAALGQAGPPKPAPPAPPPDLAKYVAAPDASFKWSKAGDPVETPDGTVHTLSLVSQTWHGFDWEHDVQIAVPAKKSGTTALLWNQGGKASATTAILALTLANKAQVPVVFVCGVPKQPLFENKTEDALIAETFVQYLNTGDSTWPLLFPMVKSVVRAMDAAQQFAKQELKQEFAHFVVTGASKRGWTAWLVGSLGDPRVKAIAPMVIDTLNFHAQMQNQLLAFGKPSRMIADYTVRGLIPIPDTVRARALWAMVDPWVYRDKLTVPKLIINGTNDPYWPLDALLSYWHDLPGEKYLLVVPNAGHDLRERDKDGGKQLIPDRAVNTLAAFVRAQAAGEKLPACPDPTVTLFGAGTPNGPPGQTVPGGAGAYFTVPRCQWGKATLWTADAPARDFREARWTGSPQEHRFMSRAMVRDVSVTVPAPAAGSRAAFLEMEHQLGDLKFTLSSPAFVVPAPAKPVPPAAPAPDKPKP